MIKNFINQRFGRLVVLKERPDLKKPNELHRIVECVCDCGGTKIARVGNLKSGACQSCGCLNKEIITKHGLSSNPEHSIWRGIKRRCYDTQNSKYADYGGRGITMSDEWRDSFEAFYRDMGPRPTPNHSIDREKNELGYSKENCRWVTQREQNNNTRRNVLYEYDGESKTLGEWCTLLGLKYSTIWTRLSRGMLFKVAIKVDSMDKDSLVAIDGIQRTIVEWCKENNVDLSTFKTRIGSGWSFEEAVSSIANKTFTCNAWNDSKPPATMSLKEWCELLGLDSDNTYLRILRGESFEDIVKE